MKSAPAEDQTTSTTRAMTRRRPERGALLPHTLPPWGHLHNEVSMPPRIGVVPPVLPPIPGPRVDRAAHAAQDGPETESADARCAGIAVFASERSGSGCADRCLRLGPMGCSRAIGAASKEHAGTHAAPHPRRLRRSVVRQASQPDGPRPVHHSGWAAQRLFFSSLRGGLRERTTLESTRRTLRGCTPRRGFDATSGRSQPGGAGQ